MFSPFYHLFITNSRIFPHISKKILRHPIFLVPKFHIFPYIFIYFHIFPSILNAENPPIFFPTPWQRLTVPSPSHASARSRQRLNSMAVVAMIEQASVVTFLGFIKDKAMCIPIGSMCMVYMLTLCMVNIITLIIFHHISIRNIMILNNECDNQLETISWVCIFLGFIH